MQLLTTEQKDLVLTSMIKLLDKNRRVFLDANAKDCAAYDLTHRAMYDRLVMNDEKVDGMIEAIKAIRKRKDPIGSVKSEFLHENGMKVVNKTAPFGTIMIIYESRPDVTVEAAVVAFKSNNKIILKGGKEARKSNRTLVQCWHKALNENNLSEDWITSLELSRSETQEYLKNPPGPIDLIVPRGGDGLIHFVKSHAKCAVLISGRGNNFLYVHDDADWQKTIPIILNAKTDKISACNALDKVLINKTIIDLDKKLKELYHILCENNVEVLADKNAVLSLPGCSVIGQEEIWSEEFLAMKICIGLSENMHSAIGKINTHSGGHSVTIMTENMKTASSFMDQIDSAAVYHNASTRFTDGGQLGIGAELAISTDKLHHRGPLGLDQLVTNKWYVYGNGQVRD